MKKHGVLVGNPPEREVTGVVDLVGPRGGITYVLTLACRHWIGRRKLPVKMAVPCVGCLVDAALKSRGS